MGGLLRRIVLVFASVFFEPRAESVGHVCSILVFGSIRYDASSKQVGSCLP